MEKKLAKVNDLNQTSEALRHKVTSYLELKKQDKASQMGTSIKDRHKFFRSQDPEFVEALCNILKSSETDDHEKFEKLVKELGTMWPHKIDNFEGYKLFDLEVDFEKFTCVILATEDLLEKEVCDYFKGMMRINIPEPFDIHDGSLETVEVTLI